MSHISCNTSLHGCSCGAVTLALALATPITCPVFWTHQSGPLQLCSLAPCACSRSTARLCPVDLCAVSLQLDVSLRTCGSAT